MIKENLEEVREKIRQACQRSGRRVEDVTLISVSKTKPVEMLEEAYEAGSKDFGEMPEDVRWHMIGHLQKNKVRQVIDKAVLIHSVDTVELAEQIEKDAAKHDLTVDILLEVNVAEEESKFGFRTEEVEAAVMKIKELPHVHIKGLMTIAPFVSNSEDNREVFKKLYQLYVDIRSKNIDNVSMSVLSMGMTGDYEVAIEEGATMIRVGTGIFGARTRNGESRV